ncbi:hypothetical protein GCM10010171_60230 [Actinokineospora fastidiosa]|uniref:Uncharacterized protein n=1 Tax=Actinokineospora fastidiosa TaxID=1816 RepID=A0A918GSE5_9PSEU|nr:hypothetical protein GCM10010171_60230 [Actinokineospora fastidiosa]
MKPGQASGANPGRAGGVNPGQARGADSGRAGRACNREWPIRTATPPVLPAKFGHEGTACDSIVGAACAVRPVDRHDRIIWAVNQMMQSFGLSRNSRDQGM